METLKLKVVGMNCPHCENKVVKNVGELNGVSSCQASYKKKNVIVEYDSSLVDEEVIVNKINEIGFKVK